MTNLTHKSFLCIYFNSVHVSSNLVLIVRRVNCINTTSGVCHSVSVTVSCAGWKDMFQATSCSSSGESIVSIQHLVYVTLCRWPFRVQVGKTCFKQPRAHHQENQLHQYNIWYMSLCDGDRFVCRSVRSFPTCIRNGHRHRMTYTRCCIETIDSPDDEHEVARNM